MLKCFWKCFPNEEHRSERRKNINGQNIDKNTKKTKKPKLVKSKTVKKIEKRNDDRTVPPINLPLLVPLFK